ncbi:MAG: hypothetical protein AB8I08_18260 [Sandaracinaceae bacterium]
MIRGKWIRNAVWGALAAACTLMGVQTAEAQLNPRARARYGSVNLRQGFMPDPQVVSGQAGGPIEGRNLPGRGVCRGYYMPQPSHVVNSRTGFRNIRFVVNADRDSTLVVILPNGQILCDDDGGEGVNPLIETSSPPGQIAVFVGSYSRNGNSSYQMGITELGHITSRNLGSGGGGVVQPGRPPVVQGGVNPGAPPMFGMMSLNRGFMPDPAVASGTSGGPIQGNQVNRGCRGYYSAQPSHVLNTQTGFSTIRFVVNSSALDTTLMVMLPDGRIACDDDGGQGFNPLVSTNSPPGQIRVWVGSYSRGRSGAYNIGYSELSQVGTQQVPAPGGGAIVRPNQPPQPPIQPAGDVVQMMAGIPVTLLGPGMAGNTVAMWNPPGGRPIQIQLRGRNLVAGNVTLGSIPPQMQDPVVTVTMRRNGTLVARAEQPPQGRGDRGQQLLLQVRAQNGRPSVTNRWSGTAVQRGPRWSR